MSTYVGKFEAKPASNTTFKFGTGTDYNFGLLVNLGTTTFGDMQLDPGAKVNTQGAPLGSGEALFGSFAGGDGKAIKDGTMSTQ